MRIGRLKQHTWHTRQSTTSFGLLALPLPPTQSMDLSSPVKRRVLGALDPNTSSSKPHQGLKQKQQQQSTKGAPPRGSSATQQDISHLACPSTTPEPSLLASEGDAKRPVSTMAPHADESGEPARKRPCLGDAADVSVDHDDRQRSVSPDTSSVFDHSAIDTSQATTVTEPDTEQTGPVPSLEGRAQNRIMPIPPRPQPMQQRSLEEVRQRAEILRLRLGLAKYKVRTGQPDVPLEQLERQALSRPIGRSSFRDNAPPFSWNVERSAAMIRATADANQGRRPLPDAPSMRRDLAAAAVKFMDENREEEEEEAMRDEENELDTLPKLPAPRRDIAPPTTPRRTVENDERLSSSALQNGAASGLLSLSRS